MMTYARWALPWCLLLLAACDSRGPAVRDYPVTQVTPSVYVIPGPLDVPNKENQGFINNPGFVLTSRGVVVIDPGSSVQVGEMVLKKVRAITSAPVIAVFNTHIHGDHWLGNQAIHQAYPKAVIYAQPRMRALASGGEGDAWVARFMQMTDGAIKGTQPVAPNADIDDGETLKLGDKHFRVYHQGTAHTDNDIMIEVVEEKVLFGGDNIFYKRTPRLDDGSYEGNIAALDVALKVPVQWYVPGHGPVGGREVPEAYRAFLTTLEGSVKKYYAQGVSDYDMKPKVEQDMAAFQNWAGFHEGIGKLVSLAYLQVEAQSFK
jgi:glyoxylase-like metal-dependent hydrolase (beta-lactamase superfamily II)